MKITLFIPVLNEIDGLKAILPSIPKDWFEQIIVVDGNSKDGSAQWCRDNGYETYVQKHKGLRHAYIEFWDKIRNPYVLTFSPDGNCKIEDIPLIFEKLKEGYDMVIASRYYQGAKSEDDSWLTGFGNWLFTNVINLLHGGHYSDAMTIFRAYRTNLFTQLELDREDAYAPENWYGTVMGVEPILSVRAAKAKVKMADVPSDEPKRIFGKRKLQIFRWGMAYMTQVFRETYFHRTFPLLLAKPATA